MIRHAATAWNEAGRIQGRTDVPLGERGRRALDGRRLPARFASFRVYSSPLARAVETAALLGLGMPVLDPRLAEMDWGEWEGETRASVAAADPDGVARNTARGRDFRPSGGESPREVQARIVDWARSVARLRPGGRPSVAGERRSRSGRPADAPRDGPRLRSAPSLPPSPDHGGTAPSPSPPARPAATRLAPSLDHEGTVPSLSTPGSPVVTRLPSSSDHGGTASGVVAVTHKGVVKATLGLACDWDLTGKAPVRLDWSCAHRFRFDPRVGELVLEEPNIGLDRNGRCAVTGTAPTSSVHVPPASEPRGGLR